MELRSSSPGETEEIAGRLAAGLVPGDVVTVSGELGAGKTTFVRGACRALGVTAPVTSPTYTVGHRYEGDRTSAPRPVPLHRVSAAEWATEPYFDDAVVFVSGPGVRPPARDSRRGPARA
jgi:tRNA threonylcarbamoyladenosine biosynthesis protein TsaE